MADYVLSCESAADLTRAHLEERNISCICYEISVDGKNFPDDFGESYPYETFYNDMAKGAETKTSQINTDTFIRYFTPFLEAGRDVVHVCLSGGLTGGVNSANIAAEELREQFPERRVFIVDSLGACAGYGLLMDKLADLRDAGYPAEKLRAWAVENRLRLNHWFYSTDLTYYVRGGRISKAAGWFGTALNICPLLNMNAEGKLIPRQKLRGRQKVMKEIVTKMEQMADGGTEYSGKAFLAHAKCPEDAAIVTQMVEERFPKLNGKVRVGFIGTTIGSHSGPGTLALFFWGKERGE